jgi:hypothetical protein
MTMKYISNVLIPRVNGHVGRGTRPWPSRSVSVEIIRESPQSAGVMDIVEEWGVQSFPASDPPANW